MTGCHNLDDLLSLAVYVRDRVNPYLFNYCFSIALLHRKDTQDVNIPSTIRSFPDKFIDSKVFAKAREMATIIPEGSRVRNKSCLIEYCILLPNCLDAD